MKIINISVMFLLNICLFKMQKSINICIAPVSNLCAYIFRKKFLCLVWESFF